MWMDEIACDAFWTPTSLGRLPFESLHSRDAYHLRTRILGIPFEPLHSWDTISTPSSLGYTLMGSWKTLPWDANRWECARNTYWLVISESHVMNVRYVAQMEHMYKCETCYTCETREGTFVISMNVRQVTHMKHMYECKSCHTNVTKAWM